MEKSPNPARQLRLALTALAAVFALVILDSDRTFQWVLARALGLCLGWLVAAGYLCVRDSSWWTDLYAGAGLADLVLRFVDGTPFRYLPPVLVLIWVKDLVLPLVYAWGYRSKREEDDEGSTNLRALGFGMVVHFLVVTPYLDAVATLLRGRYP